MKERPILFSGPMVRAILEGRKTVTRRVAKFRPREAGYNLGFSGLTAGYYCTGSMKSGFVLRSRGGPNGCWNDRTWPVHCPYGLPGDRLWVREAWARISVAQAPGEEWTVYRECDNRTDFGGPWKPSIHMRRCDSRIMLEVTDVRVERLWRITDEQAVAEGVDRPENIRDVDVWDGAERELFNAMNQPRDRFKRLWADINGAESWDANPWVWVVAFKRVEVAND